MKLNAAPVYGRAVLRQAKPRRSRRRSNGEVEGPGTHVDQARGRTLSSRARGAKQTAHHGPLERLLAAGWPQHASFSALYPGTETVNQMIRCVPSPNSVTEAVMPSGERQPYRVILSD